MTTSSATNETETYPRAGFRRRLGSYVYDFLIGFAVYMCAGAISFLVFGFLFDQGIVDNQGFEHAISLQQSSVLYSVIIYSWNLFWVGFFFVWFWSKSGQTIGMKAWRLRVQNQDGSNISKMTGVKRLLPTMLGLGNLAVLFDRKNLLSLQDRVTDTEVIVLSIEDIKGH